MRTYSKGSVEKHHGVWRAVLPYSEEGKRRRLTRSTDIKCSPNARDNRGKQAAERFLASWRDELIAEEATRKDIITSKDPFSEFCRRYLSSKRHLVKDSTYLGYVTELRRILGTELGSAPIGDITPDMVSKHESELASTGLSGASLKHHHAFLAAVFKAAVIARKISFSPMASLRSPKTRRKPINSLTTEGRAQVMRLLYNRLPDEFSVAVVLALTTGLRRGEICALRWTDIDLVNKTISVNYSFSKNLEGGYRLTSPKDPGGGDSKRTVPFGDKLKEVLELRRRAMVELREVLGLPWKTDLYVVGNALTEKPYSPDLITRDWRAFVKSNGIYGSQATAPVFHDLRHTFATLAIKEKVIDIKALSEILGHKDASMTLNVYADALDEAKRSGMEKLDAAWGM